MVPWKKTLTIPSLRKNDHRTGLDCGHAMKMLKMFLHRALLDERSRELLTQLRAIYDRFLTLRRKLLRIFPQDSGVPNCGRQDPPGGRGGVGREAGWSFQLVDVD